MCGRVITIFKVFLSIFFKKNYFSIQTKRIINSIYLPWTICLIFLFIFLLKIHLKSIQPIPKRGRDTSAPNVLFNMNDFKYLIEKPPIKVQIDETGSEYPKFIILIHSNPYTTILRNRIRETWAHLDRRALVYFMMGAVNSTKIQKSIETEDQIHNDIIQGNFIDKYSNLTYKHTMVLKWFQSNANGVKYLIKMDDDIFPNIPALCRHLDKLETNVGKYISARIVYPFKTIRDGRNEIYKNETVDEWMVTFAYGGCVIYSYDAVSAIYDETSTAVFQHMDDILFLGYIRFILNIELIDFYHLVAEFPPDRLNDENYWPEKDWIFSGFDVKEKELNLLWKKYKKFEMQNLNYGIEI